MFFWLPVFEACSDRFLSPFFFGSIPLWLTFSEQNVRFCEGDQFNMTLFMVMYVSLVSLRSSIPSLNVYTSVYIALFSSHMIYGPKRPLMPAEDEGDSWELTHFSKRANLLVLIRSWALSVRVWIDIGDAFGRCVLQNWVFTRGVIKPCSDLLQVHIHIYCTQAFLMVPKDALKKTSCYWLNVTVVNNYWIFFRCPINICKCSIDRSVTRTIFFITQAIEMLWFSKLNAFCVQDSGFCFW